MFPTNLFGKKRILLGISGGIAAYKTCELIRYLVTHGADVSIMATKSSAKFITQYTLETLSGNPVQYEMFPEQHFSSTHHINLADWADTAIIAPATANIIGKIANGIGDDFVSTTFMALSCPVVIAPAMNSNMWSNPVVQKNIKVLTDYGYLICPPEEGFLAEGYSGMGRLARLEYLIQYLYKASHPDKNSLKDKKILITSGRTEESIDPVRIFTNRSSGKMGHAMAIEAFARNAEVTLISGPSQLTAPQGLSYAQINTAREMYEKSKQDFEKADIFIAAAAVADFTPSESSQHKIKKEKGLLNPDFVETEDILLELSKQKKPNQILVGFAVETESSEENAIKKLKAKNLDFIVLNNPLQEGAGFEVDTNQVTIFDSNSKKLELPKNYKLDIARDIFNFILKSHKD
jgi:phosphopantothenoylcysteine decarboxylase/phosphopantothenate--cysteine ligase